MSALANSAFKAVSKVYKGIMASRLGAVGLKYEDLMIEVDDVEKSLKRIDHETLVAREQRIKRAFDLSVKRKTLPVENQPADPLDHYLAKELELAQKDREERAILNSY
jgi:hypothetical protein